MSLCRGGSHDGTAREGYPHWQRKLVLLKSGLLPFEPLVHETYVREAWAGDWIYAHEGTTTEADGPWNFPGGPQPEPPSSISTLRTGTTLGDLVKTRRTLKLSCRGEGCGHTGVLAVEKAIGIWGQDKPVADLRVVCSVCGGKDVEIRLD